MAAIQMACELKSIVGKENEPMKRAFATLSLFLFVSTCALGQIVPDKTKPTATTQDEQLIKGVLTDFSDAWNKHDASAFSKVFAEDADFTNVRGISAHGRTEIEKFHALLFAARFKDTHQNMTETKIRLIKSDVAAVDARWEMTGAKGLEGQDTPLRKGLLNFVMTKEGDRWFITVMHNMDLPTSP